MHSFALLATLALLAAPPARAADVKIGYVDLPRAVNEVEEGKAAKAQLKKDFDQKQKALDEMQAELKKMKDDLDKQAVVMAEEAKREKQAVLDRKFMEVQNRFMQMQQELSARERELMRGIIDKMSQVVREIAEAEGFAYVFEKNDAGLIHAPPANDLTNELVRKYNARFKGGGGEAKKKPDKPEAGKK
jgi:outer membrane protein